MGGWNRGSGQSSALRGGHSLSMIRVGLSSLAVLLVVLMLGPVIALWVYGEWRRRSRDREAARQVAQCGMCGFHFRREEGGQVAASCPRCTALVNLT